jgi:hypothetical protein
MTRGRHARKDCDRLVDQKLSYTCKNTSSVEGEQAAQGSKKAVTNMGKSTNVIGCLVYAVDKGSESVWKRENLLKVGLLLCLSTSRLGFMENVLRMVYSTSVVGEEAGPVTWSSSNVTHVTEVTQV